MEDVVGLGEDAGVEGGATDVEGSSFTTISGGTLVGSWVEWSLPFPLKNLGAIMTVGCCDASGTCGCNCCDCCNCCCGGKTLLGIF